MFWVAKKKDNLLYRIQKNTKPRAEVADHSGKWGNQIEWLDKRQMPVKWPILQ